MANRYYAICSKCGKEIVSFREGSVKCDKENCDGKGVAVFPAKEK